MSDMWKHQVRSLLGKDPVLPDFMKGGRGVLSYAAKQGLSENAAARRAATKALVLSALHKERWSKISEIVLVVKKDRAHVLRTLMAMVKAGEIDGVQQSGARREWYFRLKSSVHANSFTV